MERSTHFLHQAKKLGGLTLVSSVLGLVRELAIAHTFGATRTTDSYLVALSVPTMLYALFLGSGLNFSLVPRLAVLLKRDPATGMKIFAQVLSTTALLGVVISAAILAFPETLVRVFAPGIASSAQTLQFTREFSPLFFLFAVSYSFGSFQCALGNSSYWGLNGLTQNAVLVASLLLCSSIFGIRVLLLGTIGGAAIALLVQVWLAARAGFREQWALPASGGEAIGILAALLPFAMVCGVGGDSGTGQADIFLIRFFASRLDPGSITLLTLGNKLMGLPVVLVGSAIGLALLPATSVRLGENDLPGAADRLLHAVSYALVVICPIVVLYLDLNYQIVSFVFQHAAITAVQLAELASILRAYAPATLGLTLVYILASFLGALRRTRELITVGLLVVLLNSLLMHIFAKRFGIFGIAGAVSVGSLVYSTTLSLLVARQFGSMVLVRLYRGTFLILAGCVAMHFAYLGVMNLGIWGSTHLINSETIAALLSVAPYVTWIVVHRKRLALVDI